MFSRCRQHRPPTSCKKLLGKENIRKIVSVFFLTEYLKNQTFRILNFYCNASLNLIKIQKILPNFKLNYQRISHSQMICLKNTNTYNIYLILRSKKQLIPVVHDYKILRITGHMCMLKSIC